MTDPKPPPAVVLNDNEEIPSGSRSPHPYAYTTLDQQSSWSENDYFNKRTKPSNGSTKASSESGTEADDESGTFFKGLPAPPVRPRKGLRGAGAKDEVISPLVTPRLLRDEKRLLSVEGRTEHRDQKGPHNAEEEEEALRGKFARRRRGEIVRRVVEISLLFAVAVLVCLERVPWRLIQDWQQEILCYLLLTTAVYVAILFPYTNLSSAPSSPSRLFLRMSFSFSSSFDPAPFIYPVFLPLLLSISQAEDQMNLILPNSILGLCSLFQATDFRSPLVPTAEPYRWFVTIMPLLVSDNPLEEGPMAKPLALKVGKNHAVDPEDLVLLPLLQVTLVGTIHFLTATSLEPAELQLLSTALINLLLFTTSPQMQILKSILWIGGIFLFVSCRCVLGWELALARVPTWRFRSPRKRGSSQASRSLVVRRVIQPFLARPELSSDSDSVQHAVHLNTQTRRAEGLRNTLKESNSTTFDSMETDIKPLSRWSSLGIEARQSDEAAIYRRRHTLSNADGLPRPKPVGKRTTPGGRLKRVINPSSQSFLSLTAEEAQVRRVAYATYIYVVIVCIVLGPIRLYVAKNALAGRDPIGWAVGYLFGQIRDFRLWVVKANLEYWILLPGRLGDGEFGLGEDDSINSLRLRLVGAANTRLLIIAYWLGLLSTGIGLVLRLSSLVEVDTRRKVFHGLIVAMILPVSYIDPCFTALALVLVLAIFLLLDLLRASQVPPIARPLTTFLAPYVDGRDHRGPVIVSHIFLLIGCAIPFWLSLSGIERAGVDPWQGWEVMTRDNSMVTGVICVGMGDAAASLFGRRYGRHKWFWGGGKSIEGSVAFVLSVSAGLLCSKVWLRLGGWDQPPCTLVGFGKIVLAASGASLTEAVLTGANDNVVVPLILWLLVRGLRI